VALKCDLREAQDEEDEDPHEPKAPMVEYKQGLEAAKNIKALRYLGASAPPSAGRANLCCQSVLP
jgi:Rho family protein